MSNGSFKCVLAPSDYCEFKGQVLKPICPLGPTDMDQLLNGSRPKTLGKPGIKPDKLTPDSKFQRDTTTQQLQTFRKKQNNQKDKQEPKRHEGIKV